MKKIVFFIAALLIVTAFNFNTEARATGAEIQAYKRDHVMQNATAYTGKTDGHGSTYGYYNAQYQTVAVKKKSNNEPQIPFGTTIFLTQNLYLDGANISRSQFNVTDTGTGPGYSSYWIDVYFGSDTAINKQNANLFGNAKVVSYSATY